MFKSWNNGKSLLGAGITNERSSPGAEKKNMFGRSREEGGVCGKLERIC
jgi:hypothetical protein